MKKEHDKNGWVELEGPITIGMLRGLASHRHIEKLSITQKSLLTAKIAKGFSSLTSARKLWLWCDVTRTAMRHVVTIPGLQILDVFCVRPPGHLENFSLATSLEEFRCHFSLSEDDLIEVASCEGLGELGAQNSTLTPRAIEVFSSHPALHSLDIEGSNFDDALATVICKSSRLQSLEIGSTQLTRVGLGYLCSMTQLSSLDLWATKIDEADLELLSGLPNLKYLSIGDIEGNSIFDAETLIPRLNAIESLERLRLDGVKVSASQKALLQERYSYFRVT